VRAIKENHVQHLGDTAMPLGTSIWFQTNGVHLLLNDIRSQVSHPEAFTDLGMDLAKMKIVIVKSSQHFYAGFSPIASEVIHLSGPGAVTPDFTSIPFTKRDNSDWPKIEDPFE